jgi:two-component system, sensor histidine kinase and response regulator
MILNVDDHEPGRYAKSRLLKQAGYEVAEAGCGGEALELIKLHRPSLVMLDVNLPDMSGLEVCRQIKADPDLSSTSVLQVSASAITAGDRVGGLDNGADAYLIEPVDPDVLLATVRALLRMRKAEADLEEANRALKVSNNLLLRSNEDLQQFAYMASHDLQEPLKTVANFTALLERRYRGRFDADADQFLTHIQQGASRMSSLIQGLLLYAQAARNNERDHTRVDLNEALAWTLKNLEQSITEGAATITFESLPTVSGNETLLSQLFQNLIQNGLKYRKAEEPAKIHVSCTSPMKGMIEIAILDNGVGVPKEYQTQIFAPFRRLHGRDVPGSGIGLATCQRIVERHGGRIWVESAGPGSGSKFCFSLRAD